MARDAVKRSLDLAIAGLALLLLSPVLLTVAVLVAVNLGRPVFFRQQRPGRQAAPFLMTKFRTMLSPDPASGRVSDADRLTDFGSWLRSTSLDELPALWNVLRGDMSLVGPRPLLMSYLPRYSPRQARRHEVRPGLTGLAQIEGRNHLAWSVRLGLDVDYVDQRSTRLDLRILLLTLGTVAGRAGINEPGSATMTEFKGES